PGRCRRDDGNKRGRSEQAGKADGGGPSGRTHGDRCQTKRRGAGRAVAAGLVSNRPVNPNERLTSGRCELGPPISIKWAPPPAPGGWKSLRISMRIVSGLGQLVRRGGGQT